MRQDVLSSLQLSNPAVLTSSFNRPNIHYSIILLDVQQPAAPSTNSSLRGQASSGTAAAAAAAAGGAGGTGAVGSSTGRDAVLDDGDGDGFSDDADHAGYGHLLQLLKRPPPPQRQQRKQQQGGQEGQRRWPGPIAIVYCLKRCVGLSFCTTCQAMRWLLLPAFCFTDECWQLCLSRRRCADMLRKHVCKEGRQTQGWHCRRLNVLNHPLLCVQVDCGCGDAAAAGRGTGRSSVPRSSASSYTG